MITLHFCIKHLTCIASHSKECAADIMCYDAEGLNGLLYIWGNAYHFNMFKFQEESKKYIVVFLSVLAIKNKNWESLNKHELRFYELSTEASYREGEN